MQSQGRRTSRPWGHPGKYTMCIAENEARSPWEPLHVERGFPPDASTVTVVATTSFHQISEMTVTSGREVLNTICGSLTTQGNFGHYIIGRETPLLLVIGPEHASEMAADGFSKADVKAYVFENARMPVGKLRDRGYWASLTWPAWVNAEDDRYMVPPVSRPENVIIVVAGGDGRHSAWLPTWSTTRAVTVPVNTRGVVADREYYGASTFSRYELLTLSVSPGAVSLTSLIANGIFETLSAERLPQQYEANGKV